MCIKSVSVTAQSIAHGLTYLVRFQFELSPRRIYFLDSALPFSHIAHECVSVFAVSRYEFNLYFLFRRFGSAVPRILRAAISLTRKLNGSFIAATLGYLDIYCNQFNIFFSPMGKAM